MLREDGIRNLSTEYRKIGECGLQSTEYRCLVFTEEVSLEKREDRHRNERARSSTHTTVLP